MMTVLYIAIVIDRFHILDWTNSFPTDSGIGILIVENLAD